VKRKTIEARKAVRSVIGLLAVAWIGLAAAGCGIEDTNGSKIEDVEFTVLEEEAVPEELKQEIEERKEMDFKLTYEDNGKLYIARGYGEKETVAKAPSFPYIVVEVTKCDKNVVFE